MIHTVIFDIGRVLIDWIPDLEIMFETEVAHVVEDAIWGHEYWEQLDEGIIPEELLIQRMIEVAPNYKKEILYTLNHLDQIALKKEYAIPWVKELKEKGYRVLFLSNYSDYLRTQVPDVLTFIDEMDGGVFSCDAKLLKPNPKIYEYIIEKYQLIPEECIFIDDRMENVEAAIQAGFHSMQFVSYEDTYDKIMKYIYKDCQKGKIYDK